MASRFISDGSEIVIVSICGLCKHKTKQASTCTAYPKQIPLKFLQGKAKHTKPETGDNGIQFEQSPDVDPKLLGNVAK
jgi:hypothetical protein